MLPLAAKSRSVFTTAMARYESKPEVGSSANMIGGSVKISDAKERRFISPPDIVFDKPERIVTRCLRAKF